MLIKHKLMLNALMVLLSMAAMFGLLRYSVSVSQGLAEGMNTSTQIEAGMTSLRLYGQRFLSSHDLQYSQAFDDEMTRQNQHFIKLKTIFSAHDMDVSQLEEIERKFDLYQSTFHGLVQAQERIGLDSTLGLYGQLRSAVQEVEALLKKTYSSMAMSSMLQLRRDEKNFMLRQDLQYLAIFKANIETLKEDVIAEDLDRALLEKVNAGLAIYAQQFTALVEEQQRIGLTNEEGLRGQVGETVQTVNALLKETLATTKASLTGKISQVAWLGTVFFVVILVVVITATLSISRTIISPITSLRASISRIGQEKNLALRAEVQGKDELAFVVKDFNQMLDSFQQVIKEVNNAVSHMNTSTGVLSATASETAEDMVRQSQEAEMVTTAVTEMGCTIEEIARNTEQAAKRAEITTNHAINGKKQMDETIEKIQALSQRLESSGVKAAELKDDSAAIGSVLDVIRGVAEQTNLLALNAAIEAARAGEQGRGFAVVADEVRTLASRTEESTQEIDSIISSLQSRVDSMVSLIQACCQEGSDSLVQVSSTGDLLSQISLDVNQISDMNIQVAASIEEQSLVASEVNKNVVAIRDITIEATESAHKNSQASEALSLQAKSLHKTVEIFKA